MTVRVAAPEEPVHFENRYGERRTKQVHFDGSRGPHGFRIDMGPDSVVRTHFHRVHQFQVFFGAPGVRYQRTDIPTGTAVVHYADAYVGYGPYTNGASGYSFFTLRAVKDGFMGYLPEDRDQMPRRGRRNIHVAVATDGHGELAAGETRVEPIIDPHTDGLAAHVIAAGPDTSLIPDLPAPHGAYLCTLSGAAQAGPGETTALGPRSLGWVDPDDEPFPLVSTSGFTAVWLSFPAGAAEVAA